MSHVVEKCKYKDGHQTACCLMIDDLGPAAVSLGGSIEAANDWGYLMDGPNSLYQYLDNWLFQKYPEIRGTIFLPLESQDYIDKNMGYKVYTRSIDGEYIEFLKRISSRFEFAFHGIKHAWFDDATRKPVHEFSNANDELIMHTLHKVEQFQGKTGIEFTGGKFPGYNYNEKALDLISSLKAKWWALDADMIQKVGKNDLEYYSQKGFLQIPTNICGDAFTMKKALQFEFLRKLKRRIKNRFAGRPLDYLAYLYNNHLPITIQEHFQNQITSGKRQTPNLYDDINSLDKIYGYLRGKDVWYTNCTEMAHYFDCYQRSKLTNTEKDTFRITYQGIYDKLKISMMGDFPVIENLDGHGIIHGIHKNGKWIYNISKCGEYRLRR